VRCSCFGKAFDYSHREITAIMDLSEANCRQLHRRARQRVEEAKPRFQPDRRQRYQLLRIVSNPAKLAFVGNGVAVHLAEYPTF
jgi:hypothetical protein